jgi:transcriptional regulator with XRE-family HTH domain
MTREELLKNPAYWTAGIQMELYRQIEQFMSIHQMNKTQMAEYLRCSKGYVTQLLNGDFDHKLSKFVELALAVNKIPEISFTDVDEYIHSDMNDYSGQTEFGSIESEEVYELPALKEYLIAA